MKSFITSLLLLCSLGIQAAAPAAMPTTPGYNSGMPSFRSMAAILGGATSLGMVGGFAVRWRVTRNRDRENTAERQSAFVGMTPANRLSKYCTFMQSVIRSMNPDLDYTIPPRSVAAGVGGVFGFSFGCAAIGCRMIQNAIRSQTVNVI